MPFKPPRIAYKRRSRFSGAWVFPAGLSRSIAGTPGSSNPAPRPWRGALPPSVPASDSSPRSAQPKQQYAAFAAPPQAPFGASSLAGSSRPTLRRAGRLALGGGYNLALFSDFRAASFFGHGAPIKKPAFSDRQAVMMVALRIGHRRLFRCRVWRQRETVRPVPQHVDRRVVLLGLDGRAVMTRACAREAKFSFEKSFPRFSRCPDFRAARLL